MLIYLQLLVIKYIFTDVKFLGTCVPSCGDAIRLRVLLHHDLRAPVYGDSWHTAWYASNLTDYRTFFAK